ncbi:virulence factor Mce family protein [Mycobacterium paraterrae]|uniref:Virulence factor Mce family protein n=1 Tax=Mycobacterium paraterrae TaxID=577492 RepID=A0ABY3VLA9_9MYCO|nr:virulence factor Mce family protein [Mycobacterium paraterrae]UMB70042.1 virulence factor Mce family protein [Mycobacterium paraterrae]
MRVALCKARHQIWQGVVFLMAAMVLSSCGWKGISNVSLPGGPGGDGYTLYVQVPDTLAINGNSKVMVADVFVGSIRKIELKNWVATVTLGVEKSVKLPKNATAKIGQTSLLGSQHIELAAPADPSPQMLKNGDTIPLKNSSSYPSTEQTLASLAMVVRGGGLPNLEVLQNEVTKILSGRGPQIRAFLGKLDTFTQRLNEQSGDITHAIDSTNRLLEYVGTHDQAVDRALTEFPPLIKYLATPEYTRHLVDAVDSVGALSQAAAQYLGEARGPLHQDLLSLQCPLRELGKASPYLLGALKLIFTAPFDVDTVPKLIRGDFMNTSLEVDTTLSAVDNAFLTGTGFSGALRALEQSYGRDPNTMIPDVRYTPNPNDAPGGPLVERADRQC